MTSMQKTQVCEQRQEYQAAEQPVQVEQSAVSDIERVESDQQKADQGRERTQQAPGKDVCQHQGNAAAKHDEKPSRGKHLNGSDGLLLEINLEIMGPFHDMWAKGTVSRKTPEEPGRTRPHCGHPGMLALICAFPIAQAKVEIEICGSCEPRGLVSCHELI